MTKQLIGWGAAAMTVALMLLTGQPSQADVVRGAALWTCGGDASEEAVARLDVSKVPADNQAVRLSELDEPFACTLPWGKFQVEVTDYNSPRDNATCGAAEAWGLRVSVNGEMLHEVPAESARACHSETFNPFEGSVQADAEGVVVCQTQLDGSTSDCTPIGVDDF